MIRSRSRIEVTSGGTGRAGRVGVTVFCLFWCAIPLVVLVFMVRDAAKDAAPWFWDATDCTIVDSGVAADRDNRYAFTVHYTYTGRPLSAVEAAPRTGSTYARGYRGDTDYSAAQRLVLRYAPGARATCYVNPSDAAEAVLKREPPTVLFLLPVPLLFIAIGAGVLWYTWRGGGRTAAAAPISSGDTVKASRKGAWIAVAFFGIFFVVGASVFAAMGGGVLKVFAARSWMKFDATVVSSGVRSHNGDDGTTYSVNVLYHYSVDGREYRSNRYGFMRGSSSGYDSKRAIVNRYRPGTKVTAYVNPADPVEAVIERGFTPDMLVLLVPLVFLVVGGVGLFFSVRHARGAAMLDTSASVSYRLAAPLAARFIPTIKSAPRAGPLNASGNRRFVLKARQSPGLKFFGLTLVVLFWNGIVSVFLFHVVKGWSTGRGEVCLSIFLVPFVAVGAALFVAALHALLGLFNPRCELTSDCEFAALGDTVEFRWTFAGRYDRIHRLVLRVEGREEATYRQGTDTRTDTNKFYARDLTDTSRPADIHSGKATWAVPADTMHSFSAANNKIVWVLCLHGHIQGWPDVKDEFVLTVAPLAAHQLSQRAVGGGLPRTEATQWT